MFLTSKALIDDGVVLDAHITEYEDSLKYGVVLSQGQGNTYSSECVVHSDIDLEATKAVVHREAKGLLRHAGLPLDQFSGFTEWDDEDKLVPTEVSLYCFGVTREKTPIQWYPKKPTE